ncbi:MAG: hypothetical protein QOE08_399 [Thermoleophilaceae bacterium]|jgi:hypothetical protein|nr:hypothetical protein [Thermoleophilaceae bacterium]
MAHVRAVPTQTRLVPAAAALGAAALAVLLALVVPSSSRHDSARGAEVATPASAALAAESRGYNGTLAGAPLQRARCEQWIVASPAERLDAVRGITSTVGGPSTTGGVGTTLTDAQALDLFNRTCATRAARGFALYIIYARAAAYSGVNAQPPANPGDL